MCDQKWTKSSSVYQRTLKLQIDIEQDAQLSQRDRTARLQGAL